MVKIRCSCKPRYRCQLSPVGWVERREENRCWYANTVKSNLSSYTSKNVVKPNLSPQVPGNCKGVGFLSVFCSACHLWCRLRLVLVFSVLEVSVQPKGNPQKYAETPYQRPQANTPINTQKYPSKNTYGTYQCGGFALRFATPIASAGNTASEISRE